MTLLGKHEGAEPLSQLQAERVQLHRDLQRCLQEIHQRDLLLQQLNTKVLQPPLCSQYIMEKIV